MNPSLRWRTLLSMVFGVMLPLTMMFWFVIWVSMVSAVGNQADLAEEAVSVLGDMGCSRAGEARFERRSGVVVVYGYNGSTLLSANAAAPVLSSAQRAALQGGARSAIELRPFIGGNIALRVRPSGSCGVVALAWTSRRSPGTFVGVTIGFSLAGVLAVFLGLRWIVRPLLARLERVAGLARSVGAGLTAAAPTEGDELAAIETALLEADARLVADRRELAEKNAALERFLLDLGHDMKSPLASLTLALDELDQTVVGGTDAAQRAVGEVAYLEQLIENLRLETRYQHGLIVPERQHFDLCAATERVCRRLQLYGRRAGVDLQFALPEGECNVLGDTLLVERALANLVHNALTHGASHAAVLLELTNHGFLLQVIDDGPGVAEAALSELGRNPPAAALSTARRGEGLGLSIARRIAEAHGWTLEFRLDAESGGLLAELKG